MSAIVSRIQNNFTQELGIKMAQGATITAVLHYVAGGLPKLIGLTACAAALSTAVDAVARPIFKTIFPDNAFLASVTTIIVANAVGAGVVATVAPWVGVAVRSSDFVLSLLAFFVLNANVKSDKTPAYVF
ncbi:MAG: hypothetical protein JSR37_09470 [Verrucomicrobia bacterium]|nr:hypothetical protein [Verrucomicrobiota bacterium]